MATFKGKYKNGFESGWQLVPLNGKKELVLQSGCGLEVVDVGAYKRIIDLKETTRCGSHQPDRKFIIKGIKRGRTMLWAKRNNKKCAELVVDVLPLRMVTVAFSYVEDSAGHATKRSLTNVDSLLNKLNDIFLPQANLKFQKISAQNLKINLDLGSVIVRNSMVPSKDEFLALVANRVSEAQINVFLVWECEKSGISVDVGGFAEIGTAWNEKVNCMIEDKLGILFERVVAHEIGHNLGLKDDYSDPNLLMYGMKHKITGLYLTRKEIESICSR